MRKQSSHLFLKTTVALLGMTAMASLNAHGAELEEIVVTAQKRTQNLQDVPVSVQVVKGEDIIKMGVTDFSDLSTNIPAVNISKGGSSDQLFIRGIGSGFNGGFEQAVGTYIDGIYIGRSRATRAALVDLERIEVLKGPQTTFFGNSSIAGALNVISASPEVGGGFSGHFTGLASFNHGETNFEGAINIPVSDTLAVRVAGRKYNMDGYVKNTFTHKQAGGSDDTFVRVSAVWEPSDNFRAVVKYSYGDSFQNSPFVKEVIHCNNTGPGNPAGRPGSSCNVNAGQFDNQLNWKIQSSDNEFSKATFSQANLQMDWDAGPFTVTSITGQVNNKNRDLMDLDSGPYLNFNTNQYDTLDQFSQELRLTSPEGGFLEWMAGAYYQTGKVNFDGNQMPYFVGAPPLQNAITAAQAMEKQLGVVALRKQDEKTLSAFAAATVNFTQSMRLSLGLRYIEVKKDMDKNMFWALYNDPSLSRETRVATTPPFPGFITVGASSRSGTWSDVLPSANLEWDVSSNAMFYAKFSQGFKAGGFDFSDRNGTFVPRFEEETVDSYEVGLKSRLFDGRMQFNASLFYSDYAGVQQSVLNPVNFTFSVSNASASSTRGAEFDVMYAATDKLLLSLNATIMDAQFDTFLGSCNTFQISNGLCPLGFQDLSGHETTYAPSYSGLARATYTVDIKDLHLNFQPELFFTDGYYLQSDFDPNNRQDAFVRFNMRIALTDLDNTWEVALIGKNLNNKKVMFFANDLPGSRGSYMVGLKRSRSVAIQARYNF